MVQTPTATDDLLARRVAIATFGTIGATVLGILVALVISTEVGGIVAFLGAGAALIVAARPLDVVGFIGGLEPIPAAAITLFLLGGLVPASVGARLGPGVSVDDLPTLVAATMAAWWLLTNRDRWHIPRVIVPFIGLLVWLVVAWAIVNPTLRTLFVGAGRWGIYAVLFTAGLFWFRSATMRWFAVGLLIGIATLQALVSLWSYHSDWLIDGYFIGIERFRWYQPLFDEVNGRTTGLLGIASNFFGAYTLIPAFLALGVAVARRSAWMKASMIAVFGVLAYAGILSYTRATLIGLVLGIIGYLIFARPYRLAPAIATVLVLAVITTPILTRFTNEGNDRLALAGQARDTIFDNAFTGVGSGEYLDEEGGNLDEGEPTVTPHNSFLLQASESGLAGGLLLFASVLAVLGSVWGGSIPRRAGPGAMATAAFAGLGAVLVQTMSNNLLHIPPVATQFWMAAAIGSAFALAAGGSWSRYLLAPVVGKAAQ